MLTYSSVSDIHIPKEQVIDTVDIYFKKARQRKLSLRFLASYFLHENIQTGNHDSIEDAYTALRLYKKFLEFQDAGVFEEMLSQVYLDGKMTNFKPPGENEAALAAMAADSKSGGSGGNTFGGSGGAGGSSRPMTPQDGIILPQHQHPTQTQFSPLQQSLQGQQHNQQQQRSFPRLVASPSPPQKRNLAGRWR